MNPNSPRAVQHLAKLKIDVEHAETEVRNTESALEGVQALQRAVALGM